MPYIYENPYKSGYLAAIQELEQRKLELDFVVRRITQLEESIRTLKPLVSDDSIEPTIGLSELCAQILTSMPHIPMSASDMMQALRFRGADVSGYSNPLAVLHTTLTRLCKPGSGFGKGKKTDGQPMYFFNPTAMNDVYRSGMRG